MAELSPLNDLPLEIGNEEHHDKRKTARIPFSVQIDVHDPKNKQNYQCRSININATGIGFMCDASFQKGNDLYIRLKYMNNTGAINQVIVRGRVVDCTLSNRQFRIGFEISQKSNGKAELDAWNKLYQYKNNSK